MEITSKELHKARPQIMGVAALLVIIVHLYIKSEPHLIESIHSLAQIGVDIFLFLSGIGCYQSISKRNALDFYWRRIKRLIPSYLFVLIGYGAFKYLYEGIDIFTYWRTYSIFMFPIAGRTAHWFIFGILIVYLLTPIFYKIMKSYHFWAAFATIILISSQIYFLPFQIPNNLYLLNELFIIRIPIYMLGMYYGKKFSNNENIIVDSSFCLKLAGIILLMVWNNYFNQTNTMAILHYLSIPGAVYVTFSLAAVFNKIKILPLEWLGKCSLEAYLVNEKITMILISYASMNLLEINLYGIILTFICAFGLRAFINLIDRQKGKIIEKT